MKASFIGLAVAASLVSAQNFDGEPQCIPCLTSAISVAGCAVTDEACQCGTGFSSLQAAIAPCLISACTGTLLQEAASINLGLCSSFSASLASVSATTTTATTSSAGTASTTAGTTSGSHTVLGGGVLSTTSATAQTTSVPLTSSTATTSGSSSASSSLPSSASKAGGEKVMVAGLGGVAGLVMGVLAAL